MAIIIILILVILVIPFVKYFFRINRFYRGIVKSYFDLRLNRGYTRPIANKIIITKTIIKSSNFPLSEVAQFYIGKFDIADTIQFLLHFSNSIDLGFDSVPKLEGAELDQNTREKILKFAFTNKQFDYLNNLPDFRSSTNDLINDFIELEKILISELKLQYRIKNGDKPH